MNVARRIRPARGFTLIELLVVISIIALLISILLPALASAKRQVRLVHDLSNLKQLALGLVAYATDHDGNFPLPVGHSPGVLYQESAGAGASDARQVFVDMVNGDTEIFWCPIAKNGPPKKWGDGRPFDGQISQGPNWSIGYITYILIYSPGGGYQWDWSNSGNDPLERPSTYGSSSTAIMADGNVNWPHGSGFPWPDEPLKPSYSAHMIPGPQRKCQDSNVVFADGHGELRSKLQNWVTRQGNLGYYSY